MGFAYLATGVVLVAGEVFPKIQPVLGYWEEAFIEMAAVFNLFLAWRATRKRIPTMSTYSAFFRDVGLHYLSIGLAGFLGTQTHGPIVLFIGILMIIFGFAFIAIGGQRSGIKLKDLRLLFDPRVYRLP